jgi:hypothetical protein
VDRQRAEVDRAVRRARDRSEHASRHRRGGQMVFKLGHRSRR